MKINFDFVVGSDEDEYDQWDLEIIMESEAMELTREFDYPLSKSIVE